MKSSIIVCFLVALVFSSCRKEDNPKLPDLIRVPLPLITVDPTGDASISAQNSAAFKGKVVVDLYFKNDKTISQLILFDNEPSNASWGERYFHIHDPDGYLLSFAKTLNNQKQCDTK